MEQREESINWRNLIAACAAVCVFAFSLGEMFPLLSLSMESRGVSPRVIGFNTAMAPLGILLAGLFIPRLSHTFGAKSVVIAMAFATAGIFLLYPTFPTLEVWFPLRLLQGITVATLFALSEAWVVSNAKGSRRGLIVGVYATCISTTFGIGAAVVSWVGIEGYLPFAIGAAVLVLATLPLSLLSSGADTEEPEHVPMLHFLPKAPFLLAAIFVHANFDGGMLGFLSVYGVKNGMTQAIGALALTALSFGNVFFQIPIGWVADKVGKNRAMLACFVICVVTLIALPALIATPFIWPLFLVMGAAGFGIYTIGLATLGDRFTGPDLIAGTSAFTTVWGMGALSGSAVSGLAMNALGPDGFPHALLAIFVAYLALRSVRGVRATLLQQTRQE
ncbi:MAG TPA: MFS transporter [Candidatus Cybelea sp.]|nr:MFS transporter [Candidatus Cybelea sp.]